MSQLELSAYIGLAVLFQIAVLAILGIRRNWMAERARLYRLAQTDAVGHATPTPPDQNRSDAEFRPLRIVRKSFENDDRSVCSFYLKADDVAALPAFKPGQYLTLDLAVTDPASGRERRVRRCYSLSCKPNSDHYRLSVKRVKPTGLASSHLHDHLSEGDVLSARLPAGKFHLQPGDAPLVLIAGGIGITPLLSMLEAVLDNDDKREVWLFYGLRDGREMIMRDWLESRAAARTNFHLRLFLSRPEPEDQARKGPFQTGRIDIEQLRLALPLRAFQFYICGPGAMMDRLVSGLYDWGVAPSNVYFEAFGPASVGAKLPAAARQAETKTFQVIFRDSGKTLTWDGQNRSLLDFATDNGVRIESACRAGNCGTCQTAIETGDIDYIAEADYEAEAGHCLPCVCRPKSDLVLTA